MLLVDGYNVLFAAGPVSDLRKAREALVKRIEAWCGRTGQRARIFFDSRDGPLRARLEHVDILYVAAGETADAAIERTIAGTNDRTAFRVVSSDREVADAARARKMQVMESKEFLESLAPPERSDAEPLEKRDGISAAEAKVWARKFGVGEEPHEAR